MAQICFVCNKIFTTRSHLNRHLRDVHNVESKPISYDKSVSNYKCLEENCNSSFKYNADLIDHLRKEHSLSIEEEVKNFATVAEFKQWKVNIEKTELCNYILIRGTQKQSSGIEKSYYACNRSKNYTSKACKASKRSSKLRGTCKINCSCISQMYLSKHPDGKIVMERYKTHYGHSIDVQHLRLSREDRHIIANMLLDGVPKQRILDSFRNDVGGQLKRANLITMQDIWNVARDFKVSVKTGKKHKEDAVDRPIKHAKANNKTTIKGISRRHHVAAASTDMIIVTVDEDNWDIADKEHTYNITRIAEVCCCQIKCKFCNTCIHMFECSCPDFALKPTICKHVHFLCLNFDEMGNTVTETIIISEEKCNDIQGLTQLSTNTIDKTDNLKEEVLSGLLSLNTKLSACGNVSEDILKQMLFHIKCAGSLLDIKKSNIHKWKSEL